MRAVEAIDAPHLDKTRAKRHRYVFTKLHAFELPYEHVLLLDLDILPRDGVDLTVLFEVKAPAGKYHRVEDMPIGVSLEHGKPIPQEALHEFWRPNAGVLRIDPKRTAEARRQHLQEMLWDIRHDNAHVPTYLPEQYYLAQKLDGWHHIDFTYNHEVSLELETPELWHHFQEFISRPPAGSSHLSYGHLADRNTSVDVESW